MVAIISVVFGPDTVIAWSSEAVARLENMPEFARPMARSGIEKFAKERGLAQVDLQVLDEAREFFGI